MEGTQTKKILYDNRRRS